MSKDKKKVGIVLLFQRKGLDGENTYVYGNVKRVQKHTNELGLMTITVHQELEVHTHHETPDYRLVRQTKTFS